MSISYRLSGSITLWCGILLSLVSVHMGFFLAAGPPDMAIVVHWVHGLLLMAATVPLSLVGAWLATGMSEESVLTHCVLALHGAALAPLLLFNLLLGCVFVEMPAALPLLLWEGFQNSRTFWFMLAALGPLAGFLAWCVAASRLRHWRRQRLAAVDAETGLGWSWAAGLSGGLVALMVALFMPLLGGAFSRAA